ncbi:MAG: hypothetical protein K0S04_2683 [Herbinix sp.]|jgi:hypothetical protein|nr:hypothetical protein [Herbinix sp.]
MGQYEKRAYYFKSQYLETNIFYQNLGIYTIGIMK